jgi:hypothetical protein
MKKHRSQVSRFRETEAVPGLAKGTEVTFALIGGGQVPAPQDDWPRAHPANLQWISGQGSNTTKVGKFSRKTVFGKVKPNQENTFRYLASRVYICTGHTNTMGIFLLRYIGMYISTYIVFLGMHVHRMILLFHLKYYLPRHKKCNKDTYIDNSFSLNWTKRILKF